jgi:hypothetical protein
MAAPTEERMAQAREMFKSLDPARMAEVFEQTKRMEEASARNNAGPFAGPPANFPYASRAEAEAALPLEMVYRSRYGGFPVHVTVCKLSITALFGAGPDGERAVVGTDVRAKSTNHQWYNWAELHPA